MRTPPGYKDVYSKFIEDGWTSLSCDPKYGGQGMPKTVSAFFDEMLSSASLSFKLYSELSIGAYNCINHHAPGRLKINFYKIVEGKWSGTMFNWACVRNWFRAFKNKSWRKVQMEHIK